MKNEMLELIEIIKSGRCHFLIVSGNVYDDIKFGTQSFDGLVDLLANITKLKFPRCLIYDLFSGMNVVRGNRDTLAKEMGFKQENPKGQDAELIAALKQAKAGGSDMPLNPLEVLPGLDRLLKKTGEATAVIIDYADALIPAQLANLNDQAQRFLTVGLCNWARSEQIRKNGHLVVLVCRHHFDLSAGILNRAFGAVKVRLAKPIEEERTGYLVSHGLEVKSASAIGKISAGLSFRDLKELITVCSKEENSLEQIQNQVFSLKQKLLKEECGDILEIVRPRNGFDCIGGLGKVIAKLKRIATAMRNSQTALVPQGILLMGPPGTGKTVMAEAFAKEADLNFVKPQDLKSMWVGESERHMTRFLNGCKDLAPVIVYIDEFDQNQGQRGGFDGDSGVSRSLFKKMLEIMSDTSWRGKILWLLATNRPDLIDPAMKRPGRCDLRIPFLPPSVSELALICEAALRQYPEISSEITDWNFYADECKGYNGADMIEIIRRAWEHANDCDRSVIDQSDMLWAIKDYRPQITDKTQRARMALLAIAECSSESLLPDNWRTLVADYLEILTGERPTNFEENQDLLNALKKAQQN